LLHHRFRFQVIKDGSAVRFYSRHGADYTDRLPNMCKAYAELPARPAILDDELCLIDPRCWMMRSSGTRNSASMATQADPATSTAMT
jgi:ATP-dependent DNA ligase